MVSILIPAYNAEKTLQRCLDSVIAQTVADMEIIVVNDGSKDATFQILQNYAAKDSRIVVVDQPNSGVAVARNEGLQKATGEFILYVDADDWIEPNMLERMLTLTDGTDIVFCGNDTAEKPEDAKHIETIEIENWDHDQQLLEFMKHNRTTGMLWNKLMRRITTEGCYFNPKTGYGEDAEFLWQVLKKSQKMVITNEILYHHVMDDDSISHLTFSEKKYSAIPMWESIKKDVEQNYPQLLELARERLMCATVFSGYEIRKSGYQNKEQINHIREIVRDNIKHFLQSPNVSNKMKLFAVGIWGGYCDKVSIIIPVYNTGKYVGRCIESVLNQTYSNIEIIIVNDGSTDNSLEICRAYAERDKRIWVFDQPNAGVSAARNYGLDLATGDYVLFVDSDDTIEPNMVEHLVKNLLENYADVSCCQYDKGYTFQGKATVVWNRDTVLQQFIIHKQINGSLVNKLIKMDVIGSTRLNTSIRYGEDALFLWKVLSGVNTVVISNAVLYHVTLHDDSASGGGSYKPIRKDCIRVWKAICDDAGEIGEPYSSMARAQLGNMAFFSLYLMAYYKYRDYEHEKAYRNTLIDCLDKMRKADFIPTREIILANSLIIAPRLGEIAIHICRKIRCPRT